MKSLTKKCILIGMIVFFISVSFVANSQTDTTMVAKADTVMQKSTKEVKQSDGKRKDEFIVYAGLNFSQLNSSSNTFKSGSETGYQLGFSYRRGKFFYWQAGAMFNNSAYGFSNTSASGDSSSLSVKSIDIPITGGINILSFTNRVVGLRTFVSAIPSFAIGVDDNPYNVGKDDINSFLFYGQAGVGVNVAFITVDFGYNFGFQDLLTTESSKPNQFFVNLGFRF